MTSSLVGTDPFIHWKDRQNGATIWSNHFVVTCPVNPLQIYPLQLHARSWSWFYACRLHWNRQRPPIRPNSCHGEDAEKHHQFLENLKCKKTSASQAASHVTGDVSRSGLPFAIGQHFQFCYSALNCNFYLWLTHINSHASFSQASEDMP